MWCSLKGVPFAVKGGNNFPKLQYMALGRNKLNEKRILRKKLQYIYIYIYTGNSRKYAMIQRTFLIHNTCNLIRSSSSRRLLPLLLHTSRLDQVHKPITPQPRKNLPQTRSINRTGILLQQHPNKRPRCNKDE